MDHRELLFLRALREIDVLSALVEVAETPADLAAETELSPDFAPTIVETLVDLGYLTRVDGSYEPTRELLGILTTTDVRSIGTLPASLDEADRLVGLGETLTGSSPPPDADLTHSLGLAAGTDPARIRAIASSVVRVDPDAAGALILRGAPGRLAIELEEIGVATTVVDSPSAIEQSRGLLVGTDVSTVVTDEWRDLPEAPIVVAAPVLRPDIVDREPLLVAARDSLPPGGYFVLVERLHAPESSLPLARVADIATGGKAPSRSIPEVRETLAARGLTVASTETIPGTDLVAMTARPSRD
jgi:hypothetical protein